ncbi:MAG: mechanosensitive ion channel domain-containing protein [Elainellaceae cyanobacterium]
MATPLSTYSKLIEAIATWARSGRAEVLYREVVQPNWGEMSWLIGLTAIDLTLLAIPHGVWLDLLELPFSLFLAVGMIAISFTLSSAIFDTYLLEVAVKDDRKINSELLTLGKVLAEAAAVLVVVFCYAQAHRINLIGLAASLGIGGFAIAFASQKVIEQILWSVVLFIDRPFVIDDYIRLPDRTIGRVESIGWRSTKVRLSGKNTLVVIPNSNLAQMSVENMTGARRVISLVTLTFFHGMEDEEKALVEQLIFSSTSDIAGIDHRLTQVTCQDVVDAEGKTSTQAQITFFILGATGKSMELRQGLLEMTRENIIKRLQDYGLDFDVDESVVDVNQPMTV